MRKPAHAPSTRAFDYARRCLNSARICVSWFADWSAFADGSGQGPLRDGVNNNTPDPNNPNAARGLHESTAFYQVRSPPPRLAYPLRLPLVSFSFERGWTPTRAGVRGPRA